MFKPINIYPANISILSPNPIKIYILHTKEKKNSQFIICENNISLITIYHPINYKIK